MDQTLTRLKQGIRFFQEETYPRDAAHYRQAVAEPQRPHTLMITCADSRIDIETVTHARPGELFILRNVGNLVPAYGEAGAVGGAGAVSGAGAISGVSAVIEYAVSALKVQHVVICGHSDCGAMKALQNPESVENLPAVKSWLQHAPDAISAAPSKTLEEAEQVRKGLDRLTERNVLLQLRQLKTHPAVAEAMARGELTVSGWVYDIGSGGVRIAEDGEQAFTPV